MSTQICNTSLHICCFWNALVWPYKPTQISTVLSDKVIVAQLINKFCDILWNAIIHYLCLENSQIFPVLSQMDPVRTLPRYFILISLLHPGFLNSLFPRNLWPSCLALLLRRALSPLSFFYIVIFIIYVKKYKLQTWSQYNFAGVLPPLLQAKYSPQYPCRMKLPINIFLSKCAKSSASIFMNFCFILVFCIVVNYKWKWRFRLVNGNMVFSVW